MPRAICPLVLLALIVAGCGPAAQDEGAEPEPRTCRRIASISPGTTEILFALGAQDRLVGVSTVCDYPAEAKALPKIGDLGKPNLEAVMELKPDLFVYTDLMKADLADRIRGLGVTVVEMKQRNLQDVIDTVELLGELTGTQAKAAALAGSLRARMKAVEERAARVPAAARPKVFLEIGGSPIYTAGPGSFLHEMTTRAGGINIAGTLNAEYPKVGSEFVVEADPDVIVGAYMAQAGKMAEEIPKRIGWSRIKAVREKRLVLDIDSDLLCRPGPRLFDGMEALQRAILGPEEARQP